MSQSSPTNLISSLRQYLSPNVPFGPVDTTDIAEPDCAARLYEWQTSAFAELLRGSHVIIGRRGSGKSALIRMVRSAEYLSGQFVGDRGREYRTKYRLSQRELGLRPDIVVDVNLPEKIFEMECQFENVRATPRVEVIAQHWTSKIYFLIGDEIRQKHPEIWSQLPVEAQRYVTASDLIELDPMDKKEVLGVLEFSDKIRACLTSLNKKVVVTFDSLEEYRLDDMNNMMLSGLFRSVGQFIARQNSPVDVKLCLPAEIYDFVKPYVLNADKDITRKQFLHWTASELMHVVAHRLKIFFEVYDPEEFNLVKGLRLHDRTQLRQFWLRYLPRQIVNEEGLEEDCFRYVLRHTQMLPRHAIMIMNSIFRSFDFSDRSCIISSNDVIMGVENNVSSFRDTIIKMFEMEYPEIGTIFRNVLPRLPTTFPYGRFQSVWREGARDLMAAMNKPDFWQFSRMMLASVAVGLVDQSTKSSIYISGQFEFNTKYGIEISDKDILCVHPVFSKIYRVPKSDDKRTVLPRGSEYALSVANQEPDNDENP